MSGIWTFSPFSETMQAVLYDALLFKKKKKTKSKRKTAHVYGVCERLGMVFVIDFDLGHIYNSNIIDLI